MSEWGLLPDEVITLITRREWLNNNNLRGRLSGKRAFPLRVSLKAPTGTQALSNLEHFQCFIESWRNWLYPHQLHWQQKKYQQLGEQQIPTVLQLDSMSELITLLGPKAEARKQHWERLMRPLLEVDKRLSQVLVTHLAVVENMTVDDALLLAQLLPQLQQDMGKACYLRALPLHSVDTKFVENYRTLIVDLLDSLHDGAVTEKGGLLQWLDCRSNPGAWLVVRPLCKQSQKQLAGLPILQMDAQTLENHPLPARHILVVENKQSGYALPELNDTIAVFGGGRNTAWMKAEWLQQKHIGYWGDIDSWGLAMLSDARTRQPHLQTLMMDEVTLLQHQTRMVDETDIYKKMPQRLSKVESLLFQRLGEGYYGKTRLEQERLASDYVLQSLRNWCA